MNNLSLIIVLCLCFIYNKTIAQTDLWLLPHRGNAALFNPASLETDFDIEKNPLSISTTYRQQWTNLYASPNTYVLQGAFEPSLNKSALFGGGYIVRNKVGVTQNINMSLRAGIHLPISKNGGIALAFSFIRERWQVATHELVFRDADDAFGQQSFDSKKKRFSTGLFGYIGWSSYTPKHPDDRAAQMPTRLLSGGISLRTISSKLDSTGIDAFLNYQHGVNSNISIEPSIWIRSKTGTSSLYIDSRLKCRFIFNNDTKFSIGLGYATSRFLHTEIGFTFYTKLRFRLILAGIYDFYPYKDMPLSYELTTGLN